MILVTSHQTLGPMMSVTASRKRSLADMTYSRSASQLIDEEAYRSTVLQLPPSMTEDEVDERIAQEVHELGLMPAQMSNHVDSITVSLSETTVASRSHHPSSLLSPSTAPTSRSSSELRPVTQSSLFSDASPSQSNAPSIMSDMDKKRRSSLRNGFRKMTGLGKRRSAIISSSTLASINSDIDPGNMSDRMSIKSDLKSPASIKSSKSSWSSPLSATKSSYEQIVPEDADALQRSWECKELLNLRARQLDERDRFGDYQQRVLEQIRSQHQIAKHHVLEAQDRATALMRNKNDRAVEELESRQLEDEMKMVNDFEVEKRTVVVRLRHMEAYCQNPTPPVTPNDAASGRASQDGILPERKVTDKDYHNLAQQYRERDTMDILHASKINVLRGKQKKAVENFMLKKEREVEALERDQTREVEKMDKELLRDEEHVALFFSNKRARLERRWKQQSLVERSHVEKTTGLKHGLLPDVVAIEDNNGQPVR